MKKLLFFIASALSLAVIFGAGWASGVGKINSLQPATVENIETHDVEMQDEKDGCPDCPDGEDADSYFSERYRRGFRFRLPFPPDLYNRLLKFTD